MEKVLLDELMGPLNETEKKSAPPEVYIEGDRNLMLDGPRVSLIGSRKATPEGINNTTLLTKQLVKKEIIIVSGLAEGIDTTAHTTAIKEKGKTIAVLGTPLDKYYPLQNRELQNEIMKHHLAISQFPSTSSVRPANFPIRNRTMALISHASIIIEAGDTSGSLHQGWEALRLGRPLFILESVVNNKKLKWPQEMIKYGAMVLSVNHLKPLFEILPASGAQVNLDVVA
ncbi:MAG: DNA-processing protein DprA [Candidatus Nanoarchaeia archaeon]